MFGRDRMQKRAFLFSAETYQASKSLIVKDLPGCEYDIFAMQKRLLQIGFDVKSVRNATKDDYFSTLQNVSKGTPNDAIQIVYFTGHGGHHKGVNYILPVDSGTRLDASGDIKQSAIDINDIINLFKGSGRLILILDACRTELTPVISNYSEMTTSENVYIAYGTSFGSSSTGLKNDISWFSEAICDEILTPDIDVDTLFTRVRQNVVTKHQVQIPASVNALLENISLHSTPEYDLSDKQIYDFVEKYGDEYDEKYGYFRGENMVFIDAAQYFDISFLDALWRYQKVSDKVTTDKGIPIPILPESESKLVSFLCKVEHNSSFFCDEYHTWYYNGRQIRMGEIPPLPPSMQARLPEIGKEICLSFEPTKKDQTIYIATNLPDGSKIYIGDNTRDYTKEYIVSDGYITIETAADIKNISIRDSGVFTSDEDAKKLLGEKNRNLTGNHIKHHPIYGNIINYSFNFQ